MLPEMMNTAMASRATVLVIQRVSLGCGALDASTAMGSSAALVEPSSVLLASTSHIACSRLRKSPEQGLHNPVTKLSFLKFRYPAGAFVSVFWILFWRPGPTPPDTVLAGRP